MFLSKSLLATFLTIASSASLAFAQGDVCGIDFFLLNANSFEVVGLLEDQLVDGILCIPDYEISIEARPTASCNTTLSAVMKLIGPSSEARAENRAPFTLFGNSGPRFLGRILEEGTYTVFSGIFSQRFLSGALVVSDELSFRAQECRPPPPNALYIMSNAATGNEIIVFGRDGGTLTFAGSFPTGGPGFAAGAPDGEFVGPDDPLGANLPLIVSDNKRCLFAVNAGGEGSVSTFRISPDNPTQIELTDTDSSFGLFPASVAQSGGLVYVLNAGGEGSIYGYVLDEEECLLTPIEGSSRSLGLANENPPVFVFSPAQISFTPNGNFTIVTEKGPNGGRGTLIVFRVNADGTLSETPSSITSSNGFTPFSSVFDDNGHLIVTEAFGASAVPPLPPIPRTGAVTSYQIDDDGVLTVVSGSIPLGETTTCWIGYFGGYAITSNNGGSSLSILSVSDDGTLAVVDGSAATSAEGIREPIDFQISEDGEYVYVLSTNHLTGDDQPEIVIFRNEGTSLTLVGSISDGIPSPAETVFGVVGMAIV